MSVKSQGQVHFWAVQVQIPMVFLKVRQIFMSHFWHSVSANLPYLVPSSRSFLLSSDPWQPPYWINLNVSELFRKNEKIKDTSYSLYKRELCVYVTELSSTVLLWRRELFFFLPVALPYLSLALSAFRHSATKSTHSLYPSFKGPMKIFKRQNNP